MNSFTGRLKQLLSTLSWSRTPAQYQPLASLPLPIHHLHQLVRVRRHYREYAIYFALIVFVIIGCLGFWTNSDGVSFASKYFDYFANPKGVYHTYNFDGLLEVNPAGVHPIFELTKRAQKEWDAKLSRSSKTFEEAVIEYRRRYGRMPPRGFDRWYVFTLTV